jgi:hypothetical protein
MPFPTDSRSAWPPKGYQNAYDALREAAVWYEGSPASLGRFYATLHKRTTRVLGGFWSRTTEQLIPAARQRLHLPLAADIAKAGADMLVGEPPILRIPSAHEETASSEAKATQARFDEIGLRLGLNNVIHEGMEIGGALGGAYLVTTWDRSLADHPLIEVHHADAAVPTFRWRQLVDVVFWREFAEDGSQTVWRHLELHDAPQGNGRVVHRLYKGTREAVGNPVPLQDRPETAHLATIADSQPDPADSNGVLLPMPTPFRGLDVSYAPNMRPGRRLRTDPMGSSWGRSDYEGLESVFDGLDETYTSLVREVRLAKHRIIASNEFLTHHGPGQGQSFDLDAEVFSPLNMPPGETDNPSITLTAFEIRAEEHIKIAAELIAQAVSRAGYAPQSFGLGIDGPAESGTARRIRERESVSTTGTKQGYWRPAVEDTCERLLIIDREVFGNTSVSVERPSLGWGDAFASDPSELAQTVVLMRQAEAASDEVSVRTLHPDWTDAEVKAEVAALAAERKERMGPGLANPEDAGGDGGQGGEGEGD